jgi:hypothetical protein
VRLAEPDARAGQAVELRDNQGCLGPCGCLDGLPEAFALVIRAALDVLKRLGPCATAGIRLSRPRKRRPRKRAIPSSIRGLGIRPRSGNRAGLVFGGRTQPDGLAYARARNTHLRRSYCVCAALNSLPTPPSALSRKNRWLVGRRLLVDL